MTFSSQCQSVGVAHPTAASLTSIGGGSGFQPRYKVALKLQSRLEAAPTNIAPILELMALGPIPRIAL